MAVVKVVNMAFDLFGGIGSLLGAGFNAISQGITNQQNTEAMREINEANIKAQQQINAENLAYAKESRDLQWQRDDTAYQRGVADLASAGLNPALALGGGAGNTSAPAYSGTAPVSKAAMRSAPQIPTNIGQSFLDAAFTDAQIRNAQADNMLKSDTHEFKRLENIGYEIENATRLINQADSLKRLDMRDKERESLDATINNVVKNTEKLSEELNFFRKYNSFPNVYSESRGDSIRMPFGTGLDTRSSKTFPSAVDTINPSTEPPPKSKKRSSSWNSKAHSNLYGF